MLQRDLLRAGGDRVDEYQETQPNKGVKTSGTLHGRAPGDVVICCGGIDRGREQAGAVVGVGLVAGKRSEVQNIVFPSQKGARDGGGPCILITFPWAKQRRQKSHGAGPETRAWTQPSGWQRGADSHADPIRRNGDGTGLFRTRITFFLHCLADTGASTTKESASILRWTRHGVARKGYLSLAPSAESILGDCRALEVETRSRLRMTWCTSNN